MECVLLRHQDQMGSLLESQESEEEIFVVDIMALFSGNSEGGVPQDTLKNGELSSSYGEVVSNYEAPQNDEASHNSEGTITEEATQNESASINVATISDNVVPNSDEASRNGELTINEEATQNEATITDNAVPNSNESSHNSEFTINEEATQDEATPNNEAAPNPNDTETSNNDEAAAAPVTEANPELTDQEMLDSSGFYHPHLITMKDWREELYESIQHYQQAIVVDRSEDFANAVLEVYRDIDIDLYSPPDMEFDGEDGRDGGGLKREYFWLAMIALRDGCHNGRLPYFEGENDFKLPSCDATLLRRGYFKLIGKFMLHSAVHMGIGFVGLSNVVIQYILMDKFDYETPIEINIRDLPDLELRLVIESLDKWTKSGESTTPEDKKNIQKAALDCGFHDLINLETIPLLREHLLYFNVVEKRRSQLDCLRQAFQESKLMPFLRGRNYLYYDIFPSSNRFIYPASVIVDKITAYGVEFEENANECVMERISFVKDYVLEKLDGNEGIQDLVTAWTGWPDLPEGQLQIQTADDEGGEFCIHTCSQLMVIPSHYSKEDVFRDLDMVLRFACYGFGSS